jgi:hypothetical protein
VLFGQDPDVGDSFKQPHVTPGTPQWAHLSVKEKLQYDWQHLLDPENFIFSGVGAGLDQWADRPPEWGQGWRPFGQRYASHIGKYLAARTIRFTVQAVDHEEPRYRRSTELSIKRRIGDALLYTVWRPSDEGDHMPAYSEFFGAYGSAAVSRAWWPPNHRTFSSVMITGSNTVLIDAGINLFHEFTPEIKRLFPFHRR